MTFQDKAPSNSGYSTIPVEFESRSAGIAFQLMSLHKHYGRFAQPQEVGPKSASDCGRDKPPRDNWYSVIPIGTEPFVRRYLLRAGAYISALQTSRIALYTRQPRRTGNSAQGRTLYGPSRGSFAIFRQSCDRGEVPSLRPVHPVLMLAVHRFALRLHHLKLPNLHFQPGNERVI